MRFDFGCELDLTADIWFNPTPGWKTFFVPLSLLVSQYDENTGQLRTQKCRCTTFRGEFMEFYWAASTPLWYDTPDAYFQLFTRTC